ncbi:MAG: hypothetical protein IPM77_12750 [Crocinitomicaceae bacterium]|nr:hypothetical protein [Crocinitomicaceae bacterium]
MQPSFKKLLQNFAQILNQFENPVQKTEALKALQKTNLPDNQLLISYHDMLLFILSHPQDNKQLKIAESEMRRVSAHLGKVGKKSVFADSGLPFTTMTTRYSHDLMEWMMRNNFTPEIDTLEDEISLNDFLKNTLPALLRDETTAGLSNDDLFVRLGVKPTQRLPFLIQEFKKLNMVSYAKEQLWQSLNFFASFKFDHLKNSKSYNRFEKEPVFYQTDLVKKFDHQKLLNTPVGNPVHLKDAEKENLIAVIRLSMIQTLRETDTATYMDENSLRYYVLDRGMSIAFYGMIPQRQLAFQSYIGYTLFKNGYPTAYGGSWIFGRAARFGLNVFEPFRGGESGLIMCQLLRTYKQVFNLNYIEVDAFQFGKDNPDGIKSGAYWFYYRYGFRSLDKKLAQLAEKEMKTIQAKPGYRTSEKTLTQLAESNVALEMQNKYQFDVEQYSSDVIKWIKAKHGGNHEKALNAARQQFKKQLKISENLNADELAVLDEVSLYAATYSVTRKKQIHLLADMIKVKPVSPYTYNVILTELLNSN